MHITVRKEVAQKMRLGYKSFEPWGIPERRWTDSYGDQKYDIDLARLSKLDLQLLKEMLEKHPGVKGTNVLINDISLFQSALATGAEQLRARTVRQFQTVLQQYMVRAPRQHLYKRLDENAVLCYYVNKVDYHEAIPSSSSNGPRPAMVSMELLWYEFGAEAKQNIFFEADECRGIPVSDALIEKGFAIENAVLRAEYEHHLQRYRDVHPQIGKQYHATGYGKMHESDRYSDRASVQLDKYGDPSRVVVDVWDEGGKAPGTKQAYPDRHYWFNIRKLEGYNSETDDDDGAPMADWNTLTPPEVEIPVHPWIVVFHLQKHLRLRAHVAQLTEYVYDTAIAEKLVLPKDQKELVKLLIDTKGGAFQDIVAGKSGGAIVLLSGAPGTGKTLTAEVYAESEQRALYSVQCSQLGMNPETLEKSLMVVFDRARRWNAVMLLDEADVYVHERGTSMQQNAIVGVFLRVLEYQGTVLFLTTNRPEDVDDAIASRCIARLAYEAPGAVDAARIWRVLVDVSGATMADETIAKVVELNPGMSGRDIKNILKLAGLMKGADTGITVEHVEYVKQFKPTGAVFHRNA